MAKEVTEADWAFDRLVKACREWANNHMDQWEKFALNTEYGKVYVTISRMTEYPDDPEFKNPK